MVTVLAAGKPAAGGPGARPVPPLENGAHVGAPERVAGNGAQFKAALRQELRSAEGAAVVAELEARARAHGPAPARGSGQR